MESNGYANSKLLTAGGALSIIAGVLEIVGGGIAVAVIMKDVTLGPLVPILPVPFLAGREIWMVYLQNRFVSLAAIAMVLGVIAIIGGISALRRKSYGLSLAGAVCALPSTLLGVLAVILVALGKREFRAENWLPKRHSDRHNVSSGFRCYDSDLITMQDKGAYNAAK